MMEAPLVTRLGGLNALVFDGSATQDAAPAIIWLHGMGERGVDPMVVANYGLPAALVAGRATTNCPVICPQLPPGASWKPSLVQSLIDAAQSTHSTVAIIGFSLGGQGVLDHLGSFGPTCVLHVAVAPDAPRDPGAVCRGAALIVVQGELDFQEEVSAFTRMADLLGVSTTSATVPGGDHFISESWLQQPEVQSALRTHGLRIDMQEGSLNKFPPSD